MRIAISSTGPHLDARLSPVFGRCPVIIFVDTEATGEHSLTAFDAVPNPATTASGGAGIRAAQFVVEQGAEAVISGNLGPNAFQVLQAAGVAIYTADRGTVQQAVEAFQAGTLSQVSEATAAAHAGMGWGRRGSLGLGRGQSFVQAAEGEISPQALEATASTLEAPAESPQEDIAALKEQVQKLSQQLNDLLDRLEQLQ